MSETSGEMCARVARGVVRGLCGIDDYDEFVTHLKDGVKFEVNGWANASTRRNVMDALPYLDFRTLFNNRKSY